ncbi:MAG TPA: hypothetical protein VGF30_07140 [Bacteroidia bacterium]
MKKIIALILISFAAKGQFLQYGFQGNFFPKQTITFERPVILDPAVFYEEKDFVLSDKLIKLKDSNAPGFEAYTNFRFNQNNYVGLNYRYFKQNTNSTKSDIYAREHPTIKIKSPAIGICYGHIINRRFVNYFFEAGVSMSRLKFDIDWTETPGRAKYSDYLNQKNTFLLGYGKVGLKLWVITMSARFEAHIGDVRNRSAIKKITYRPTINLGMDIRSDFFGKKRFKEKDTYTQLDDDVKFQERMDFGKLELEYGISLTKSTFAFKEPAILAYPSLSLPVQILLKDKWTQNSGGLAGAIKFAPFKKKRLVIAGYVQMGQFAISKTIGTANFNYVNSGNYSVATRKEEVNFATRTSLIGLGLGYRVKVTSSSFMEIAPVYNLVSVVADNAMSTSIKGYFKWKSGFSNGVGLNVSYKKNHWGASLRYAKGISDMENNKRFKNGSFFSLVLLRDVNFIY